MPAPSATRPLLLGILDYAGLFPPAGLPMAEAAARFSRYRTHPAGWMLGAFVVPAPRLPELAATADWSADHPWPLSVLCGGDGVADAAALADLRREHGPSTRVTALEIRVSGPAEVAAIAQRLPSGPARYFEVPWDPDPAPWIAAVAAVGEAAKIRTGGVTPDLIPPVEAVARFLRRCHEAMVPFKATAGLHHPVRSDHPLTYEEGAPVATMHGFLNVFVAGALLEAGQLAPEELESILSETDPAAFAVSADAVRWRDRAVGAEDLARARQRIAHSFGSCSFEEPVTDLQEAGWL